MGGRTRLGLVTVLTVGGLLLAGGAINALADEHGGGNRGGGRGRGPQVERQQQQPQVQPEVRVDDRHSDDGNPGNGGGGGNGNPGGGRGPNVNPSPAGGVTGDDDARRGPNRGPEARGVQREVEDENEADELVSAPGRVSGEERPGFGCGDENHVHTGPPGNPDLASPCKDHDGDDDED